MATQKVLAGIYKFKGEPNEEADFAILYGENLCFIEDGMCDIFHDVECGGLNDMELVEGYALATVTKDRKWQIRNSGLKHTPDYIIAEGTYRGDFVKTLEPFKIAMG